MKNAFYWNFKTSILNELKEFLLLFHSIEYATEVLLSISVTSCIHYNYNPLVTSPKKYSMLTFIKTPLYTYYGIQCCLTTICNLNLLLKLTREFEGPKVYNTVYVIQYSSMKFVWLILKQIKPLWNYVLTLVNSTSSKRVYYSDTHNSQTNTHQWKPHKCSKEHHFDVLFKLENLKWING